MYKYKINKNCEIILYTKNQIIIKTQDNLR